MSQTIYRQGIKSSNKTTSEERVWPNKNKGCRLSESLLKSHSIDGLHAKLSEDMDCFSIGCMWFGLQDIDACRFLSPRKHHSLGTCDSLFTLSWPCMHSILFSSQSSLSYTIKKFWWALEVILVRWWWWITNKDNSTCSLFKWPIMLLRFLNKDLVDTKLVLC